MKNKLFYFGMANFFLALFYLGEWARVSVFFLAYVIKGKTVSDDPSPWWLGLHKNHPWIFLLGVFVVIIAILWTVKNRTKIDVWIEKFFFGEE